MATATGLAATVLLSLLALLARARRGTGRSPQPVTGTAVSPDHAPAETPGASAETPVSDPAGPPGEAHPESLTAVLDSTSEEYLAWLADHHWPADEYLDLELEWRNEFASTELPGPPAGTEPRFPVLRDFADHGDLLDCSQPYQTPLCPQCRLRREDVWPCPKCGRLLHSTCGHGMRRRRPAHPYRTRATDPEAVTAEWICTGCRSIVGLDVDHDDEADDDLLR
ncbi:hypothetical protein GCM10023085_47390 [Actinomadura viridis]|uniref:Uncharacterized protein n=1 Tax=Actinomadura viridis TaxID=58110 RepID=A0A931DIQ6_9ACTN|nr:hypothetical protein [Actinomadura viridis]MBG6090760.1 hypothetical protein [Actinomadura viridis]